MSTVRIDLESLRADSWSEQEVANVELIVGFVQRLMNDHDFDLVLREYGNPHYRQHNRSIPDGMPALVDYVKAFVKRFPDYSYDVKRVLADGDYVIFHSHITTRANDRGNDRKGINVFDTWRVENGRIVEHWDSLQPLNGFMRFFFWITGGRIANRNGVF